MTNDKFCTWLKEVADKERPDTVHSYRLTYNSTFFFLPVAAYDNWGHDDRGMSCETAPLSW